MCPRKSNGKHEPAETIEENARLSTPGHSGPIPASNSQPDSSQDCLPERKIEFDELEDGSLVEMIEDPANPAKSLLAVYSNGAVRYTDKLHAGSELLVPLPRTDLLSKHVSLPQGAEPYGGLRELMGDVGCVLRSCLDSDCASLLLMIAHVFSTWFPERLPFAPYLALVGPPISGKTTALRILTLLCRRSLPTSDITSAAFYDVCHCMHPTILIDETRTAGNPRTLLHLLRSSSSRGFVALRKDKAQLAYGPKVLSWVELPNDAALNSRCIIIPMHRTSRTDLNSADDPKILQFAAKVRMRLLQFRFEHYRGLSIPRVPDNVQLSSRALDLYRALALPLGADQEFCEELAHLIADQRQFQPSLLSPAQASALRVLHALIHIYPTGGFTVGGLTPEMNLDLASRGESSGLTDRKTGDILTSLGLTNRSRKHPGNIVLWLDRSDRVRIHEMARDYEVDGVSTDPIQNCEICTKKEHRVPGERSKPEGVEPKQIPSAEPKREHRERREHRSGGGIRSTARSINRLR